MDQAQLESIPLIRLAGIREVTLERSPCSVILEFLADEDPSQSAGPHSPNPRIVPIRIAEFVQIVAHLQSEGAIPELPWDWIHQMGNDHGLALHSSSQRNTESADHT
jgi:hypothetical protein